MTEEKKENTTFLLLAGIALGAIIAYFIMKNNQPKPQGIVPPQNLYFDWKPLSEIPQIPQIQQPVVEIPQIQPIVQLTQPTQPIPLNVPDLPNVKYYQVENIPNETAYKNSEKWKITRNDDGDIDQIEVIRDAKITK